MADNIDVTPGAGKTVAADEVAGALHQRVKLSLGADGTAVDAGAGAGAVGTDTQRVTLASDDPAVVALQLLDNAISGSEMQVDIVAALPAGTNAIGKLAANSGVDIGDVDVTSLPALPAGTNLVGKVKTKFIVATASAMTRPANTTAYTANDAVSDNATAGSVTAISLTVSDVNDDNISLDRCRIASTDTGVAGKAFRIWFFRSDPTASTGIVGGDNEAFSTKQGTFMGTMSGTFRTFSDGSVAVCVPDEGARIIGKPTSGAMTVFALLQTLEAFTPSGNSTTFTLTAEGFQGAA